MGDEMRPMKAHDLSVVGWKYSSKSAGGVPSCAGHRLFLVREV